VEAILFDWDGTLVDSLGAFHRANSTVMEAFGLPFDVVRYRQHYVPDWREMYRRLGVPHDRLDEANSLWQTTFGSDGDAVTAFPGTLAALERLRDAGATLGIVTAGHRAVVEPQLSRTGLGGVLPIRVFGDDLPVHKPDPEPLRLALRMAGDGHRPATSIYLGDAPTDIQMAVAVGARPVGIESVLGDPAELLAAGALELAPSVAAWVEQHLAARGPAARGAAARGAAARGRAARELAAGDVAGDVMNAADLDRATG
jgi:beta-phosphoglucomutase-like phosphatase (HAD superfamily)